MTRLKAAASRNTDTTHHHLPESVCVCLSLCLSESHCVCLSLAVSV